jgi:pimeloyl-ACP methyl ester carboxylesterase
VKPKNSSSDNTLSRRDFASLAARGLSLVASAELEAQAPAEPQSNAAHNGGPPLDIAEWSYFWVGVERAELARGTVVNGKQMYVEYQTPAQVRHPYPIVLVHGGGGQGTDWMGTPDGRRGWATFLLEEGYKVYVVDRPGHGRSPFHPDLHGPFPQQVLALENMSGQFTPPNSHSRNPNQFRKLHNQWPGTGEVGSPDLDQLVASQGGSYVTVAGPGGPSAGFGAGSAIAHQAWRERGAMLLDKIGPAIIMTHAAGGPFGWLVAEVRPNLVKGIVVIEGGGTPFNGANVWGLSTIPVTYDPLVSDPSEILRNQVKPIEPGLTPYFLQQEPAHKLKNLLAIPMVIVTSEASFASPGNPGAVAFLKQAGCKAEELRLVDHNIHGNGHMMMVEKNNREVLQPILDWVSKNVEKDAPIPGPRSSETALKLANQGFFWVGTEHKSMPYGTIIGGQMYVQYLVPTQVRHPYAVVLVHGGGGQMLHYMGAGDGQAGWAHYYAQEGYRVYLVDRPGHGRAPYHPDALGPIGPAPTYSSVMADLRRAAVGPNHQYLGTAEIGDPVLDKMVALLNSAPKDNVLAQHLWASRGAELLDKIGPSIIQVHSAGGPFSWLVANERPNLVKAIVNVEGAGAPFTPQTPWGLTEVVLAYDPPVSDPKEIATRDVTPVAGSPYKLQAGPARKLKNLQGIPIIYVTAERSGRNGGPVVEFLQQAGCNAEDFRLKDHGLVGNGHFMMIENNRRQVFDVLQGWIEKNVPAKA